MFKIFDEKINGFLFTIVLPFLLFFISYYGFETSYVAGIKSWEKVPDFMFSSVYAYRVIPNYLSVHVTEALAYAVNNNFSSAKAFILKQGSFFYHSTFLINVFFFLLTSLVLHKILRMRPAGLLLNDKVRHMVHLIAVFFIVIMQYVPTNCDCIALFFYVLGLFFTLKYSENRKPADLILLSGIIFISTLVRETACLNIAFFAAVFIQPGELKKGNFVSVRACLLLAVAFVLPYMGLRLIIQQNASFVEGIYVIKNFISPYNLAGLLFGIISLYCGYSFSGDDGRAIIRKYLFFSSPYLIMITFVGLFWETRLFMPLTVTGFVAASYQFKKHYI
ncbi:hypothetical protein [Chryseobacterium hagamense]|uniref:Glycosyltransferase RgtA/B/C/D-like domain-containing protein n=1 Tax=Chryseobacterium hagamense TaxID=395935 RepID=A0A511YL25_9FLAO|nr:hypothetical protein [Chryseobacterium hagamense]GEN75901.1 hypothetical protein CHA01nite_16410 [Chryseobacterium hagamense]